MTLIKRNITKTILNIVLDILIVMLGIILLITIYNNIQIKVLGNDYASFFGHSVFEVQTGSMEPEISAGDWIIVKYDNTIRLNDIVTFEHNDEYITHRVIETYNQTFVTKGDANTAKDSPITKDQIIGKVTKILPNFGILRKTIFNPIVLIFLIITCYIAGLTFKEPTDKEIEVEKELLDKIKNKLQPIKEKVMPLEIKVEEEEILLQEPVIEQIEDTGEFEIIKKKKEKKKVEQPVVEELVEEPATEETKEEPVIEEVKTEELEVAEEQVEELEPTEETKEDLEEQEDELDKTVFYRMVSVSEEELSTAYNTPVMIEPDVTQKVEKEEVIEVTEDEVKSSLELIQKKKKKCKNFIEKVIYIKKQELEELINIILQNEKLKTNEPTIRDIFIDSYIDAKYYNNCGEINLEYNAKNMNARIEKCLIEIAENLKKKYKGSDKIYSEKVDKFLNITLLINYLEQDFKKEEEISSKKDTYLKRINKYITLELKDKEMKQLLSKIIKHQKKYNSMVKFLLNKLETGMFELKFNNLTEKNTFAVELQHNIQFSKVYSEYIVDKTYSEGIVAEDKIEVLSSLLLAQLVKDMFQGVFNKKYVIYIPETLYEKNVKLDKILKMLDDDFAKNCINIVVQFDHLNKNKKIIRALIKEGYHFSTDMNNVEKIKKTEEANLHVMDYIFMTKTKATKTNLLEQIPDAVKDKITYDDIASKVGNF